MHDILITAGHVSLRAVLGDTPTARELLRMLPVKGITQLWGDEIYFTVPLKSALEHDAREEVEAGELGYWPEGPALCIFFGPTPVSTGKKPRAYSPVNIVGRITDDMSALKDIPAGTAIVVRTLDG